MLKMLKILFISFFMARVWAVPGNYGGDCTGTPTSSAPPSNPTDANYQQKLGWFIRFADAFMYPNNTIEAAKINSTLFSDTVQGRVDLTSTFDGRELNTEYIFGLFSTIATELNPSVFNILGVPTNYTITGFTVTGNQVVGSFIFSDIHQGGISLPIEAILFLQFNDAGEITEYDATLRRADWFFDTLITELSPLLVHAVNFTGTPTKDTLTQILLLLSAQSVCAIHDIYCLGPNQQYPDHPTCLKFMTSIPFGQPYQLGQNTSGCRNVHQNMVPLRPEVHCPHIGPSGGGACVPRDYVQVTTQKYFLSSFSNPLML